MSTEMAVIIAGALITTFLGILAWIGKRTIERVDKVHEKTIEVVKAVYSPNGEDRIRQLENSIDKLTTAIYDPEGTNGLLRKVNRIGRRQRRQQEINLQIANALNVVKDRLDLKYDVIKIKD